MPNKNLALYTVSYIAALYTVYLTVSNYFIKDFYIPPGDYIMTPFTVAAVIELPNGQLFLTSKRINMFK